MKTGDNNKYRTVIKANNVIVDVNSRKLKKTNDEVDNLLFNLIFWEV